MVKPALNEAQLMVPDLFSQNLNEEEMNELKQILAKFQYERMQKILDQKWEENGWSQETMDEWLNEHYRTPYLHKD